MSTTKPSIDWTLPYTYPTCAVYLGNADVTVTLDIYCAPTAPRGRHVIIQRLDALALALVEVEVFIIDNTESKIPRLLFE